MMITDAGSLLKIEPKYYWQVMFSMWITGKTSWYFVSYDPRFTGEYRMHTARIEMPHGIDEFITDRVKIAQKMRDETIEQIGFAK